MSGRAAIVRVRAVKGYERQGPAAAWPVPAFWVSCRLCPPGDSRTAGDFLESLLGESRTSLGWAPSWQLAMSFADAHASLHADRACPTCQHVPDGAVSLEDTHAVMRARV